MAIPTTGSISIKEAAGSTRSIDTAVTSVTSGSLVTLSQNAIGSLSIAPYGMREFYGYAHEYTLTQGTASSGAARGYISSSSTGSISPTTYGGATINYAYLFVTSSGSPKYILTYAFSVAMSGNRAKSFFTTFTGGGHTLASSVSIHNSSSSGTSWVWIVNNAGDWDGSGDLTVTIT